MGVCLQAKGRCNRSAGSQRPFSPESPHRDRVCPSRTRCKYIPVSSDLAIPGQIRSWMGTPDPGAPWKIRRHKPHFVERSGRCSDPWRFRCRVSGAMVVPGGTYLAMDGQMRAARDGLSDPGRHHHCPASPIRSTEHRSDKGLWHPAGSCAPFRGQGPLPQKKAAGYLPKW